MHLWLPAVPVHPLSQSGHGLGLLPWGRGNDPLPPLGASLHSMRTFSQSPGRNVPTRADSPCNLSLIQSSESARRFYTVRVADVAIGRRPDLAPHLSRTLLDPKLLLVRLRSVRFAIYSRSKQRRRRPCRRIGRAPRSTVERSSADRCAPWFRRLGTPGAPSRLASLAFFGALCFASWRRSPVYFLSAHL